MRLEIFDLQINKLFASIIPLVSFSSRSTGFINECFEVELLVVKKNKIKFGDEWIISLPCIPIVLDESLSFNNFEVDFKWPSIQ